MRQEPNDRVDRFRRCHPMLGTSPAGANWGYFQIAYGPIELNVISSGTPDDNEASDWEHVSVSTPVRCPTWDEMNHVKRLFWCDDEAVVQFHPPKDNYVNCHRFCLHMWKPLKFEIELPPEILVGPKLYPAGMTH